MEGDEDSYQTFQQQRGRFQDVVLVFSEDETFPKESFNELSFELNFQKCFFCMAASCSVGFFHEFSETSENIQKMLSSEPRGFILKPRPSTYCIFIYLHLVDFYGKCR